MNNRKGEKIGWIAGWTGGFIWVLLTACLKLFQHDFMNGIQGTVLFLAGISTSTFFSPWRHPAQQYWKLMLAPFSIIILSLGWFLWLAGGYASIGLNKWSLFLLLPLLIPFATAGRRRWSDQNLSSARKG